MDTLDMEWLEELRAAVGREYADAPTTCTLATRGPDGWPRARTMVCREIDDAGGVWFNTDARSAKAEQLEGRPQVAACFWLPDERVQFRLMGVCRVMSPATDPEACEASWQGGSGRMRSLFLWPTPGAKREADEAFVETVSAEAPVPDSFRLLCLSPAEVDRLDLGSHPHRRKRWLASDGWRGVEVNP